MLEKRLTDELHTYVKLRKKGFEKSSEKLEESGKILEKDMWVRAHWKETPLKKIVAEIDDAPEQLKYLNEVTTSN